MSKETPITLQDFRLWLPTIVVLVGLVVSFTNQNNKLESVVKSNENADKAMGDLIKVVQKHETDIAILKITLAIKQSTSIHKPSEVAFKSISTPVVEKSEVSSHSEVILPITPFVQPTPEKIEPTEKPKDENKPEQAIDLTGTLEDFANKLGI